MNRGHNTIAAEQLRSIVDRIERMEQEKAAIADDIKEIYTEARGNGWEVKAIRQIVKLRKKAAAEREEEEAVLDVYLTALGMRAQGDLFDGKAREET